MNRPITRNFRKVLASSEDRTYEALKRFHARPRLEEALIALGVEDRVVASHGIHIAPRRALGHTLVWQLAGGGRVELNWTAWVSSDGADGSTLSIKLRAAADSETSRAELLAAWPVLGRMAEGHARRTIVAIAELADRLDEIDRDVPAVRVPVRRAA